MSDKKWPQCQTTHPECVIVWRVNENTSDEFSVENHYAVEESDSVGTGMSAADAHYTRTDIAEARIAELEAERDTLLRDCWEACGGKGPDSSDDELVGTIDTMRVGIERMRAQRDALRARIGSAPTLSVIEHAHLVAGEQITGLHDAQEFPYLAGKRVALVVLGDDE